ncbi:hypothetical protein B0H16DRAFT_1489007 [Mycena metata]|uniref:Uncharacterized protein n=1 Tax=Mycena metata TaxID=1033252 RepID=A0AAD7KHT4_9AGAR|nr:hypothetical protein B0H16DRAFT_1489007 [Mycena metata]
MPLPAHTTLIIAVAAGSVGGLLLLFLLYLLLRRPQKQLPLPPKQELARYREHQIQVAESRPPTWYDSGSLSAPPSRTFTASKSSLLPPDSRGGSPFRRASLNTSESPSEDMSNFVPMVPPLYHPRSFDTSSSSLSTAETGESPTSPLTSTNDSLPQPRPTSSSSRNNRRSRPLSVGSNVSSAVSRNSRHNIRGVPHGPHSQVQIVLPAPLAFNDRMSYHEPSARFSVVDQWAPMAVRSEGNLIPRPQRRSVSHSDARRPTSQSGLSQPPVNAQQARTQARRSVSASSELSASLPQLAQPPPEHRNYSNTSSFSPPPVPRIPQQWLPPSGDGILGIADDAGRGRSRDNVALVNERPPQPADRPPPPLEGQRKLQKRIYPGVGDGSV